MPVKPDSPKSTTSKGPNGKITVIEIKCETSDGLFLLARVEDPVIIPKAVEDIDRQESNVIRGRVALHLLG
jgi:hypothetical protein